MSRLLLADDLTLYEDGTIPAPPAVVPASIASELPAFDGRYVGRVLTVAADGTLAWVYNPALPVANARDAHSVLYIGDDGRPYWRPVNLSQDVVETDDDGVAQIVVGPDTGVPPDVVDGSMWFVSRNTSEVPTPPAAPSDAPVLTVS